MTRLIGEQSYQRIHPQHVTSIGSYAFYFCTSLTSITIPGSVTSIGTGAFSECYSLSSIYFLGNAPYITGSIFIDVNFGTVYYLPGTVGWDSKFQLWPTAVWLPQMQTDGGNLIVQNNQFGFNINWASGRTVVVEACTNLASPIWFPVSTNTLTSSTSHFSDPAWRNYPGRFYRLRSL